jgi:two-component system chemotaxis sensor kinase CheA
MDQHKLAYREEALEILAEMESTLLELESSPADPELIGKVFRQMHTIKGSGAMFGFDEIASFTHEVETVYDQVRSGHLAVTPELINLTLASRDHILNLLHEEGKGPALAGGGVKILAGFHAMIETGGAARRSASLPELGSRPSSAHTFRIRFVPPPDLLRRGTNLFALFAELGSLGSCSLLAQLDRLPALESLDPECCYLSWDAVLTTDRGEDAIRDVFIFVEEGGTLAIEAIEPDEDGETPRQRLGEILVERQDVPPREVEKAIEGRKRVGELLVEQGTVEKGRVQSALMEQEHVRQVRESAKRAESGAGIRVAAEKIDALANLVGELVTMQARLSQFAAASGDPELQFVAEEVERLTGQLRDSAMSIRMVPIGSSFGRFRRLVRDLSRELGKDVELAADGGETELDKTVMERLNDALVHIVRNAVDHGIEAREVRQSQGKPARGVVRLSASHSGAHVLIRVSDDGAGLDARRIRAKAVEKGLIGEGEDLSEKDLFALILRPGFSTAATVTDVSGRGVGMDVVAQAISALRGSIEIASGLGKGVTITLKLPLTLAIIDGLLTTVGGQYFVLPQANIIECVELSRQAAAQMHGKNLVIVRGELVPYLDLHVFFAASGERPEIAQVLIAETEAGRLGLVVDRVIGDYQTVIKPLGALYRGVTFVSGATLLGDGAVALILDPEKLASESALRRRAA